MSPVLESAAKELVPLTNPKPLPPVALSPFNRMSLDRKDPVDGTGMELAPFCYALTYAVPPEKHAAVVESLYRRVYARLGTHTFPWQNLRSSTTTTRARERASARADTWSHAAIRSEVRTWTCSLPSAATGTTCMWG